MTIYAVGSRSEYNRVHGQAREALPSVCEYADETCKGRLECALRKDAPADLVRTVEGRSTRYYIGSISDGYFRLCISHHARYDTAEREYTRNVGSRTAASGYHQSAKGREDHRRVAKILVQMRRESGFYGSEAHLSSLAKARCQRHQISHGKPCICGQHEEIK